MKIIRTALLVLGSMVTGFTPLAYGEDVSTKSLKIKDSADFEKRQFTSVDTQNRP